MEYNTIVKKVEDDSETRNNKKLGFCRIWVLSVIKKLRGLNDEIEIDAREVDITPSLQHTFLRIKLPNEKPFILDGVGTVKHEPYMGPEEDAPEHLQNSRSDIINKYI